MNSKGTKSQPLTGRAWLFQANPKLYHIEESLGVEKEELWNLNQHAKEVGIGDRVLVWVSGKDAGIYAIGTIVSEPVLRPDSIVGMGYWVQAENGRRSKARVRVRYDRVFLDHPLRKVYIVCDPALAQLQVMKAPRGTNFAVTNEEWQALVTWFDGRETW